MTPPKDSSRDDATYPLVAPPTERAWLVVIHAGTSTAHALPPGKRLTVGRLEDNDVVVADPAISRAHAEIDAGPPVRVRDLGSHNGVRVRGERLARDAWTVVGPGEAVELGPVTLLVQRGAERPPVARAAPRERVAAPSSSAPAIVVRDPAMRALFELIDRVADSEINVLILGETGTGKEVVAEAVHRGSPRNGRPFLRLNCAALSPTLLESELFGHEKGAFTGAAGTKPGLLETAEGGTVFLDEIGEMPLALQAKLLRVIEERKVMRVGALAPRPIDVRFVAATHRDLAGEVARQGFRQDLYFRLNGIALHIPPLRERVTEIDAFVEAFAARAVARGRPATPPAFSTETMALLRAYAWPGNIRELRNVVERAVLLAGAGPVTPAHLPSEVARPAPAPREMLTAAPSASGRGALRSEMEALERQRIVDALAQCNGNQSRAAKLIGMPRRTFLARLEAYGIPRPRKGASDE